MIMLENITIDDMAHLIQHHEGLRLKVYLDTEGIPTAGFGHAFIEGSNITPDMAYQLFRRDFMGTLDDYEKLELDLDSVRKGAILNMLFNLGWHRFNGFKKMLKALRVGNYKKASEEMLDSKWARQVKGRACDLAYMMGTGRWVRK